MRSYCLILLTVILVTFSRGQDNALRSRLDSVRLIIRPIAGQPVGQIQRWHLQGNVLVCGTVDAGIPFPQVRISNLRASFSRADSTWRVWGVIRDSIDSTPLPGATVSVNLQHIVSTDTAAHFVLTRVHATDTLRCFYLGYLQKSISINELVQFLDANVVSTRDY